MPARRTPRWTAVELALLREFYPVVFDQETAQ